MAAVFRGGPVSATSAVLCADCQHLEGLSEFWAQDYIGSDLAKELVSKHASAVYPKIAVWDASFENEGLSDGHGVKVENLITGVGQQAVSGSASLMEFVVDSSDPRAWVKHILEQGQAVPKLVNVSAFLSESAALGLEELSQRGTISVLASGNDFPVAHAQMPSYSKLPQKIIVGSMSPYGLVSGFSEESESVTVLAPSDFYVTSALKPEINHGYTGFDGTSGAAPIVTGAIANVLAFLPGLNFASVNDLIKQTAIPTLARKSGNVKNGVGLINAYYMARVAQRVADQCKAAEEPQSCASAHLQQAQAYQFDLNFELKKVLELTTSSKIHSPESIQSIRKEALLHPHESFFWDRLGCALDAANLSVEGAYYHQLALITSGSDQKALLESNLRKLYRNPETSKHKVINYAQKTSVLRSLIQLSDAGVHFAKQIQSSGSSAERMIANDVLSSLGENYLDTLSIGLLDSDSEVKQHAIANSPLLGFKAIPKLAELLKSASSSESKVLLVQVLCTFGSPALPYLREVAQDPDFMVRYYFERGLEELGAVSLPYLEILSKDSNATISKAALKQMASLAE